MNKIEHLTDEQLALYAGLLRSKNTKVAPNDIAVHIAECNSCASEALELSFILDDLDLKQTSITVNTKSKINIRKYYAAAAAILLPILIWTVISLFTEINIPSTVKKFLPNRINDTVDRFAKDLIVDTFQNDHNLNYDDNYLLAESYIPHPETESIINSFKTGSYRSDEIIIHSESELIFSGANKVLLKWKNPDAAELQIEIFDNEAVNIESKTITTEKYTIEQKLENGLYYWKLFNEEYDLLFCGKIIIK